MKYVYGLLIVLLLALSGVSAEPEKLDDRWVNYGDTFEDDNIVYFVEKSNNPRKMLLYADDRAFIIDNGTCDDDTINDRKYCIEKMSWVDYKDGENDYWFEDYIKYESGEELLGFYLVTYTLIPELDFSRQVKPTEAEVGTQSIITVTLMNEGEEDITNIRYEEFIPESLKIFPGDGFMEGDVFVYEDARLVAGAQEVFQYRITPQEYVDVTLRPNLTYVYENIRKDAETEDLKIDIDTPMEVTITKSASKISVDDEATYSVLIENEEDTSLSFTASIELPDGMMIDKLDEMREFDNTLVYEETIRPGRSESFGFTYHTPLTGTYKFELEIEGTVGGRKITQYYDETITTKTEKLSPRLLFSQTDNKIFAGKTATLRLYLKNNEEDLSFVNILGEITSELITQDITTDVIVAGEDKLVKEMTITAPAVEKQTNKEFAFTGTYETRNGEIFDLEKKLTISIIPVNDLFAIIHSLNTTQAHPGDTIRVQVEVENLANRYIFANIDDSFSESVTVSSGSTTAEISFEEEQKRDVYLYEITIPEEFSADNFTIITSAKEEQATLVQTHESVVTVVPKPEEEQETTPEDTAPSIVDEENTENEPNFLVKAWRWLTGLFN